MKKNFSFNISGRIFLPKLNLNTNSKYSPKLTKRQLEFNSSRPVKEYKRFISFRESFSGIDPYYKYIQFMKKDNKKPLRRSSLYKKSELCNITSPMIKTRDNNISENNRCNKWAVGTVARAPDEEKLPKKQQFKNYYFPPKYNNKEPDNYRHFFLSTDHIAIKIPKLSKVNSDKSFLRMKAKCSPSNESTIENQWVPYTERNLFSNICSSSKDYNIINFAPINLKMKSTLLKKQINNKKKGVMEYYDLTNSFRVNFNKEYSLKIKENPKIFYIYNGAFTNMYDASNRNGRITLPFESQKNKS